MKSLQLLFVLAGFLSLQACAHAGLSKAASSVEVAYAKPEGNCRVLGVVEGQGGGAGLGRYLTNRKLLSYATNEARNKAAALGATHVQINHKNYGVVDGTVDSAMVSATAYLCE